MSWKVAQACVRGSSHRRSGLPNQDAVQSSVVQGDSGDSAIAVVADGHGGARHFRSQVGSALAVSIGINTLRDFLALYETKSGKELFGRSQIKDLERRLVDRWMAAVSSDLENNPLTQEELGALENEEGAYGRSAVESLPQLAYGATLLAVTATPNWILYLQLGDGEILNVSAGGETTRPLPPDSRLMGNQTTSLCRSEAPQDFRSIWLTESPLPPLILLSTDGYANSFRSDEDFLKIGEDYLDILRAQGISGLAEELPEILNEATEQGSGDDIALAIIHEDLWPSVRTSERAPLRPVLPATTRSGLIDQLKAKHSSQRRQLDDLSARVQQTQQDNRRLRNVIMAMILAIVIAPLAIFHDKIFREQPHAEGTPPKIDPNTEKPFPGKPGTHENPTAPLGEPEWTLHIHDKTLSLHQGSTIPSRLIHPQEKDQVYAQVAQQNGKMILINDSTDTWQIKSGAVKEHPTKVGRGMSVELGSEPVEIAFAKDVVGNLAAAGVSAPQAAQKE